MKYPKEIKATVIYTDGFEQTVTFTSPQDVFSVYGKIVERMDIPNVPTVPGKVATKTKT